MQTRQGREPDGSTTHRNTHMGNCEWCSQPINTLYSNSYSFGVTQGYFCSARCRSQAKANGNSGTTHPKASQPPERSGGWGPIVWVVVAVAAVIVLGLVLGNN